MSAVPQGWEKLDEGRYEHSRGTMIVIYKRGDKRKKPIHKMDKNERAPKGYIIQKMTSGMNFSTINDRPINTKEEAIEEANEYMRGYGKQKNRKTQDEREKTIEEIRDQYSEGDFIYASWGYNQTNIEFAKIVEVSDTGKTIKARRVGSRRLEGGDKTSAKKMPKDNPYGEPFRLRVKEANGKAVFSGKYPTVVDEDGKNTTRSGTLFQWDKSSIRETRTGMGH